jgi:hypothetical protein
MIKPTIGRIVWYNAHAVDPLYSPKQLLAAIVTAVHSDTCVNLAVFGADGSGPRGRTSVTLDQAFDEGSTLAPGTCGWMPFQKKQAEKHAAEGAKG